MYTAECTQVDICVPTLNPILTIIGSYLCSMCNSTDKMTRDVRDECKICSREFCKTCGRGCNCWWRYQNNTYKAVKTIRRFILRYMFTDIVCGYLNIATGVRCVTHISKTLKKYCYMKSRTLKGRNIMCRCSKHGCLCQYGYMINSIECRECCSSACKACKACYACFNKQVKSFREQYKYCSHANSCSECNACYVCFTNVKSFREQYQYKDIMEKKLRLQ
jgi:hypothetical protein